MQGAGFASRSVQSDDQVRPLKGQTEPPGKWDANQRVRGALPADTSGKVVKRMQTAASPDFVAGVVAQFQGKTR